MRYEVYTNINGDRSIIDECHVLDTMVYTPELAGEAEPIINRNNACPDSILCVKDMKFGLIAGYICYFPCRPKLWVDIMTNVTIVDDEITGNDITPFERGDNNVYLLSVVVHPDYRDGEVIKLLSNAWSEKLWRFQSHGYKINAIAATAVSEDGQRFLSRMHFRPTRTLDDGYIEYLCEKDDLRNLLAGRISEKGNSIVCM